MDELWMTTNRTTLNEHTTEVFIDNNTQPTKTFLSYHHLDDLTYWVGTAGTPVLLVLGCYGNVMTVIIMRSTWASDSTGCLPVYFTALALSDLFQLCTQFMWYWPATVLNQPMAHFHDLSCTVLIFVSHMSAMTSAWLLVAMTCQRMTSVVIPHRVELLCSVTRGKMVASCLPVVCLLFNMWIFFSFHVQFFEGYPVCVGKDRNVMQIFTILYICFSSLLPFLCLIVANSVIIWGVIKSVKMSGKTTTGSGDQRPSKLANVSSMTTTLILTSAAFLVLTLPFYVTELYLIFLGYYDGEIEDEVWNQQLALLETVCLVLHMSNSAINFYIYILSGRKFRQEAKRCMCYLFGN